MLTLLLDRHRTVPTILIIAYGMFLGACAAGGGCYGSRVCEIRPQDIQLSNEFPVPAPVTSMDVKFPIESLYDATSGCAAAVFTVGADGSVSEAKAIYSVPKGRYENSTVAAIQSTRFEKPKDGKPTTSAMWRHYQFGDPVPEGCHDGDLQAVIHAWRLNRQ